MYTILHVQAGCRVQRASYQNRKQERSDLLEGSKGKGGGVGGRVSRSLFTENKLVLSQFTGNKIGTSRFTKKMSFFDTNLRNL